MPFGTETLDNQRTRFRLWAPSARSVELILINDQGESQIIDMPLRNEGWRAHTQRAAPGTRYRYRIDDRLEVPDPASRHNPDDVHSASEVIEPTAFEWSDGAWRGRQSSEAMIYEAHVVTFSPDGTFAGVERRRDYLAALGVSAIEPMPIAEFPGKDGDAGRGLQPLRTRRQLPAPIRASCADGAH